MTREMVSNGFQCLSDEIVVNDRKFTKNVSIDGKLVTSVCDELTKHDGSTRFHISCLVIQKGISKEAMELLKKWTRIDVVHIFLPLNCPKAYVKDLQTIGHNIVFLRQKETLKNANLPLDCFVDFMQIPCIKVQYEVDEKLINTILKQWTKDERSLTGGLYANRRGKTDKLDILLEGLMDFSSEFQHSEMGTFFVITVPEVGQLAVSYTTMSFSAETTAVYRDGKMMKYDENFNPLMHLDQNVELNILKHLKFWDYLNLAFTCRRWYETASTAPDSVKPSLYFDGISTINNRFEGETKEKKKLCWTLDTEFILVNKVYSNHLQVQGYVRECKVGNVPVVLLEYLERNISHFMVKSLYLISPLFCESDTRLMTAICNMTSIVVFDETEEAKALPFKQEYLNSYPEFSDYTLIRRTILNILSQTHIHNRIPLKLSVVNEVVKQRVCGQRPNLKKFTFYFDDEVDKPVDHVIRGVEKYVETAGFHVVIIVPELAVLHIYCVENLILLLV